MRSRSMQALRESKHKAGIIALVFSACLLLFLPGCRAPVGPRDTDTGTVSLRIENLSMERAVMPDIGLAEFSTITAVFTRAGASVAATVIRPVTGPVTAEATLPTGSWTLTVTAYLPGEGGNLPSAIFTGPVTVNPGSNNLGSINLAPMQGAGYKGTFSWDITFPDTVTGGRISVRDLDDLNLVIDYEDLPSPVESPWTGSISLYAGDYFVFFQLYTEDDTAYAGMDLHVFRNMDSHFEFGFDETDFETYIPVISKSITGDGVVVVDGEYTLSLTVGDYVELGVAITPYYATNADNVLFVIYYGDERVELAGTTLTALDAGAAVVIAGVGRPASRVYTELTVTVEEPAVITVAAQVGNLYAGGGVSSATFTVTASNIPAAITSVNFATTGVVSNLPTGVTASGTLTLTDGAGTSTLTLTNSTLAVAGVTDNVTVTVNDTVSNAFTVTVLPPPELPLGNLFTFRGIPQPAWADTPIPEGSFEDVGPFYGTNGPNAEWVIDVDSGYLTLQQTGRTENWHGIYIIPGADGLNLIAHDVLTIRGRVERLTTAWSRVELYGTPVVGGQLPTTVGEHPFELIWRVGEVPSGNIRVQANGGGSDSPTLIIDNITVERFVWELEFDMVRDVAATAGPFAPIGPLAGFLSGGTGEWVDNNGVLALQQSMEQNWHGIYIIPGADGLNLAAGDMVTFTVRANRTSAGWARLELNNTPAQIEILPNDALGEVPITLIWIVADVPAVNIRLQVNGANLVPTLTIDNITVERPTLAIP